MSHYISHAYIQSNQIQLVYVVGLAYFIFKLVRIYTSPPARKADYAPAARTLTVFAVIAILLLLITIVVACWCTHNFNKGLKPHVSKSHRTTAAGHDKLYSMNSVAGEHGPNVNLGHPGGSRMEID
jgi:uncharacterized membrane protein